MMITIILLDLVGVVISVTKRIWNSNILWVEVLNKIIEQGNGQIELMEDGGDWLNVWYNCCI